LTLECQSCGRSDYEIAVEIPGYKLARCRVCGNDWVVDSSPKIDSGRRRPKRLAARPPGYEPNPRLISETAAADGIAAATHLWIEAGAMSGPPTHRHQIEFAGDLVRFFIDPNSGSEFIPIRLPSRGEVLWRPLTARGTDYGQWTEIWRLGLPTPLMGGPAYAGRVISFTRRRLHEPTDNVHIVFDLEVADLGSTEAATWERDADSHGTNGRTGAGQQRRYGWW
jgi:hypothetical protein